MKHILKWTFIISGGIFACLYIAAFYFVETRQVDLLFPNRWPRIEDCKDIYALGAKLVDTWRDTQHVRYLLLEGKHPKGWVILFHGNGGSICYRTWHAQNLKSDDWNVALVEYPGYGGDGNIPSEELLKANCLAVYDEIAGRAKGLPIVLFGKSLGSGFATYVASQRSPKAMILHTPYTSINLVAWHSFYYLLPIPLMNKNPIRAEDWAPLVRCPILALHGDADTLIPLWIGRREAAKFKAPLEFVVVSGADHNTLAWMNKELYWGKILNFLSAQFSGKPA